jgi:RHS repeat-associated protein
MDDMARLPLHERTGGGCEHHPPGQDEHESDTFHVDSFTKILQLDFVTEKSASPGYNPNQFAIPFGVMAMPVTRFIYDGDAVLQETDGAGVPLVEYTRTGPEYGDLLSDYDGTSARYYEPDGIGSTDALTDQSQTVVDRWAYQAFGATTQTVGTDATPFLWVGRQGYVSEPSIELYLLGSGMRFFDPATAQFLSVDPIGFAAGDQNTRRYASNNPLSLTDPSGLEKSAFPGGGPPLP